MVKNTPPHKLSDCCAPLQSHPFPSPFPHRRPMLKSSSAPAQSKLRLAGTVLGMAFLLVLPLSGLSGCGAQLVGDISPVPTTLSCSQSSLAASDSDTCTVALSGPAPSGGVGVDLSSSSKDVSLPASATIPASATSADFTLKVSPAASSGTVTLTASANGERKSFWVHILDGPPPSGSLSGIVCSPSSVTAPGASTCSVTLTGPAPSGGSGVKITSSEAGVTVPTWVVVAAGATNASFTASVGSTAAAGTATLTAAFNGITKSTALQIEAAPAASAALSSLSCAPTSVTAPGASTCTVSLSRPAPSGGSGVKITSSEAGVTVPTWAVVAAGATNASFTASVASTAAAGTATLTAAFNGVSKSTALQIEAAPTVVTALKSLSCAQASLMAPGSSICTVTLSGPAPATGSGVKITSSEAGVTVPTWVVVAAGATSASFTTSVSSTATAGTATLTAAFNGVTKSTTLQIVAASSTPALSYLSCTQPSVSPGGNDTCAVGLSSAAATGGAVIQLKSSSTGLTLPSSVSVAANATSATFVVNVGSSATAGTVTLTATLGTSSKATSLQVVSASPTLSVNPTSMSFGSVTNGTTSTKTVTLTPGGSSTVTINSASVTGTGFSLAPVTVPVTLTTGQTLSLSVRFAPSTAGTATGTLQISSNSSTAPNLSVPLTGTGVAPTSVAITLTPTSVSTAVGSTQQFTASVTGTTNTAVNWSVSGSGCSGSACGTISASGLYTAPSTVPSPASVTVTATSQQDTTKTASAAVQILSGTTASSGKTYYIAPASAGGSDSNSGASAGSPWLTPLHSVNCGDVLLAAPGTYSAASFNNGQWGTVSCPAGNNVAWVKCATPFGCTVSSTIYISASYWGLQGFRLSSSSGSCLNIAPNFNGNRAEVHHILVANNVVGPCGFDGVSSVSGYATNPTIGADYLAYLGNIAYDTGGNSSTCAAALSFWVPIPYDTQPGTHLYMAGNFSWGNTSNCGDAEGIIFDTFDGVEGSSTQPPYAYQAVAENNLTVFNNGPGIQVDLNENGSGAHAPIYFMHNTSAYNCLGPSQAGYCAQIVLGTTDDANANHNLVVSPTQYAFGGGSVPEYGTAVMYASGNTNQISNEFAYSAFGYGVGGVGSSGFVLGPGNITSTNPGLANPTDPGTPNCSGYATTTACMANVISNFSPTDSAASSYGYQQPSSTPVVNAYYPQWLCGVSDLPTGIITPGCAP